MSAIREFVMNQALFDHHDHHCNFDEFEAKRPGTGLLIKLERGRP